MGWTLGRVVQRGKGGSRGVGGRTLPDAEGHGSCWLVTRGPGRSEQPGSAWDSTLGVDGVRTSMVVGVIKEKR